MAGIGFELRHHLRKETYGGILRAVYLEPVRQVGFASVQVLPRLPCRTCDATIEYRVMLRNYSSAAQSVRLTGSFGQLPVDLGTASIAAGATRIGASAGVGIVEEARVRNRTLESPRPPGSISKP